MSTTYFNLPHRSWFFILRSFLVLTLFLGTSAVQAQLPFITTWQTTTADESITIPTTGTGYSYTVDWGDGGIDETVYTEDATHSYAANGSYTVSISGDFPRIYFNYSGDKEKILTIEQWGDQVWANMRSAFHGCNNLTYGATNVPNLSSVTDMYRTFADCKSFNGDLSSWDVSSVNNMWSMFSGCTSFNQDLSSWDVSSVTDMGWMFSDCSLFDQGLPRWDVSSVTEMDYMFNDCTSFNQDLSSWDVSSVTDMGWMFSDCSLFDQDLSGWDVGSVTNMEYMFQDCFLFDQDLSSWDVSRVTDMSWMFYGCDAFDGSLSSWDVNRITDMSGMFYGCDSFDQDLSSWDVSSVTDMSAMFQDCTLFNQDLSSWDVSSVTDMSAMFQDCTLFNQDLSSWDVSSVTDMHWMFNDCLLFDKDLSIWDVSSVTNMGSMFSGCSSFDQDLSGWDVSSVTNMGSMFSGCLLFDQDLSIWDVSRVVNMNGMFRGCILFNGDLSRWDVSKVLDMSYMFYECTLFNGDISNWDVSNVTTMIRMFEDCESLNGDLSSWDVSSVVSMSIMFSGCILFNQDLSSWDVSNVTQMNRMLDDSDISTTNYDKILNKWSQLEGLSSDVTLGVAGINYCSGESARETLINDFGWTINDSGKNCLYDSTLTISIDENNDIDLAILVLSTFDMYSSEINNFEFIDGNGSNDQDNDLFTVDGGEFYSTIAFDYETKTQYFIYVREIDNEGYYLEKEMTVLVSDVNEAPILSDTVYEINTLISEGSIIASLEAIDPEGDTVTYTVLSGNTDGAFSIDENSNLIVANTAAIDKNENAVFVLSINFSDGSLSNEAEVIVNVEYILSTSSFETNTNIYPNPVRNTLYISSGESNLSQSKIQIIDLTGHEIMKLDRVEEIDVSSLKSGIYILRMVDGHQVLDTRFMKY